MTREEAIGRLKYVLSTCDNRKTSYAESLNMAIKALEQQPCYDRISRQAVLSYIVNELGFGDEENGYDLERKIAQEEIYNFIKKMSSVAPKEKTGKWTRVTDKIGHLVWECGCGWQQRIATNFCPDCGCHMVEPQKSEDKEVANDRKNCLYRQEENGNCLPVGGFCLAVTDDHCKYLKEVKE